MDKINRALYGVEDNAENIRALKARMKENTDALTDRIENVETALERNKIAYDIGQYKIVNNKSNSSFGTYRIDGPTIFVIAPGDLAARELYFNNKMVLDGTGALIYAPDSGVGELRIQPNATSPRILVIGDAEKIQ